MIRAKKSQFHYGSIEILIDPDTIEETNLSLNSIMVRLKYPFRMTTSKLFSQSQFHYGSIEMRKQQL